MSCKEYWAKKVAGMLGRNTFVAPAGVPGAEACIREECEARINHATGRCLSGHSQKDVLQAAQDILKWDATMGGWEAPCWGTLQEAVQSGSEDRIIQGSKGVLEWGQGGWDAPCWNELREAIYGPEASTAPPYPDEVEALWCATDELIGQFPEVRDNPRLESLLVFMDQDSSAISREEMYRWGVGAMLYAIPVFVKAGFGSDPRVQFAHRFLDAAVPGLLRASLAAAGTPGDLLPQDERQRAVNIYKEPRVEELLSPADEVLVLGSPNGISVFYRKGDDVYFSTAKLVEDGPEGKSGYRVSDFARLELYPGDALGWMRDLERAAPRDRTLLCRVCGERAQGSVCMDCRAQAVTGIRPPEGFAFLMAETVDFGMRAPARRLLMKEEDFPFLTVCRILDGYSDLEDAEEDAAEGEQQGREVWRFSVAGRPINPAVIRYAVQVARKNPEANPFAPAIHLGSKRIVDTMSPERLRELLEPVLGETGSVRVQIPGRLSATFTQESGHLMAEGGMGGDKRPTSYEDLAKVFEEFFGQEALIAEGSAE